MASFLNKVKSASQENTEDIVVSTAGIDEAVTNNLPTGFTKNTSGNYIWYDNYYDESYSTISAVSKTVTVDPSQVNLTQEENSQFIPFKMPRYYDGIDLNDMLIAIHYVNANDDEMTSIAVNVCYSDSEIRFGWLVDNYVTYVAGNIRFEILVTGSVNGLDYTLRSKINNSLTVIESLSGNGLIEPSDGWESYLTLISSYVTNAQSAASSAATYAQNAQNALSEVQTTIANATSTIAADVTATVESNIGDDYYNKTQVNALIDSIDISDQLATVETAYRAADTALQQNIDAIHSVDNLQAEYTPTNVDGENTLSFYDMHGQERNHITSVTIDQNPTETWATAFKDEIDTDISNAVIAGTQPIATQVDTNRANISTLQSNLNSNVNTLQNGINTNRTNVTALTSAVNALQEAMENINVSQQYTYSASYGDVVLEGNTEPTSNVFTLYEIEDEGGENEVTTVKSQFVIEGGGGGGSSTSSTLNITRVTNSPLVVSAGNNVLIEYNYESFDGQGDSVDGTAVWKIGSTILSSSTIGQGNHTFDATNYCTVGEQKLTLTITNDLGTVGQKSWNVKVVEIGISTTFNSAYTYSDAVEFPYTPIGSVEKTVYIKLDGTSLAELPIGSAITGTPLTYTILPQPYGSHLVELYIRANVNGVYIEPDHIFKDIMWVDQTSTNPIISCDTQTITAKQYDSSSIRYTVYDPSTETPTVQLYADGVLVETRIIDSSSDVWVYKSADIGEHTLKIVCGSVEKIIHVTIEDLGITISPVTTGLEFDFNPTGRSNSGSDRIYTNNGITMSVSNNFDWTNGGYQTDSDGNTYFLVKAGTRATIPFDMFSLEDVSSDPKRDGRAGKFIYKITNVRNVATTALSCYDNTSDVGFRINPHEAYVNSSSSELYVPLSEEDIVEYEFVIAKSTADVPMVMSYEDGCPARPMIYTESDSFVHDTKIDITIGSDDCDIAIYRLKLYSTELTDSNILNNFIADARSAEDMIERYYRNQIYNASGVLTPESVADACPDLRVFVLSADHFTNDKNDKVGDTTVRCLYYGGADYNTDNWTATGCTHNGQGTSSNWYGLSGRNLEIDLRRANITFYDGTSDSTVQLSPTSYPTNYLNLKVNVASSENANNALLQKRYERFRPYTTLADQRDDRLKNDMEFFNCVFFIQETNPDITTHREFGDTNIHFYAIGNIGDSKKTDNTRAYDPSDPYEFTLEITDYDVDLATFPVNTYMRVTSPDVAYIGEYYEMINNTYTLTSDTVINPSKIYYYDALGHETYDDDYSYDTRYGDPEKVKLVWPEFYAFVTRSLTDSSGNESPALVEQWKRDFKKWFVLDSATYYYVYTLFHTMVDNRAKNSFWHYAKTGNYIQQTSLDARFVDDYYVLEHGEYVLVDPNEFDVSDPPASYYRPERKFDFWDYDNDTALGIDNRGELSLTYGIEEDDVDSSSAYYWRGHESTFFTRLAKYFEAECSAMYNSLAAWSAENIISEFDLWQNQFPEELWRLDYERKYLRPYIGDEFKRVYGTDYQDEQFLRDMMNGRKKYQRRQFLRDQEIYMASKFPQTSGFSNFVQMRCSSPSDVVVAPNYTMTITPYSNMYINVMQGQNLVSHIRATAGVPYQVQVAPEDTTNIDFIYVQGANRISSLGDLSRLYLSYCSIGSATKLQTLILGNETIGYSNTALTTIGIGSNTLLEEINLHNVSALQGSIDLSGCWHLRTFDARGTSIGGVVFANGGEITNAYLPSSISSIVIRNCAALTNLAIEGYDNLRSLVIENSEIVNSYNLVSAATNLTTARLIGINWDSSYNIPDTAILERLYNIRGLDASLSSVSRAVLTGYFYATIVKEQLYHRFVAAWNGLTIEYASWVEQFVVTFVNDDDDHTVLDIQYVDKGGSAVDPTRRMVDPISIPAKTSTVSTDYTFTGWDVSLDSVFTNRTVTAVYSESVRNYTINYAVNGRIVQTSTGPYGSLIEYNGDTPTYTAEESAYVYRLFTGWDKSGLVTGDKTINAVFDTFVYSDGAFDEMTSDTMRPVEYYALTKFGNTQIQSTLSIKDSLSFEMGEDFDYSDVMSRTLIDSERVFDGTTTSVFDTEIDLTSEDKSWVLAIDYKLGEKTSGTLFECYQGNSSTGFKFAYRSNYPYLLWGSSSTMEMSMDRDIVVLRHVAGETGLHVYKGNLPATQLEYNELAATRAVTTVPTSLVFGGSEDFGEYEDPTDGTIYWAKLWYADLGDTACRRLAAWTHEKIELELAGFRYYYLSDNTGRSNITWLASKVLENLMQINTTNTNAGGWASSTLNANLNNRFYNAIPVAWRQLIKQVSIPSSEGNRSTNITNSDCYVGIPAVIEVSASYSSIPYSSEGGALSEATIPYMTSDEARIRKLADGTPSSYYTRSPNADYNGYFWYVDAYGSVSSYSTSATRRGVVIELSF